MSENEKNDEDNGKRHVLRVTDAAHERVVQHAKDTDTDKVTAASNLILGTKVRERAPEVDFTKDEPAAPKVKVGKIELLPEHEKFVRDFAEYAEISVAESLHRIMKMGYSRHFALEKYAKKVASGEKKPPSKKPKRPKKRPGERGAARRYGGK